MKNKEKYAKEIIEISCNGGILAVSKVTGKPICCKNIRCEDCNNYNEFLICEEKRLREWAESEYIEKPVISKRDRAFLEYIKEEFKYISRDDGNEQLFAWSEKPQKGLSINEWLDMRSDAIGLYGFNLDLPMVKWSDSEPWLIEDLKKLEVVDSYE